MLISKVFLSFFSDLLLLKYSISTTASFSKNSTLSPLGKFFIKIFFDSNAAEGL
jgi:hypothetical protein